MADRWTDGSWDGVVFVSCDKWPLPVAVIGQIYGIEENCFARTPLELLRKFIYHYKTGHLADRITFCERIPFWLRNRK